MAEEKAGEKETGIEGKRTPMKTCAEAFVNLMKLCEQPENTDPDTGRFH